MGLFRPDLLLQPSVINTFGITLVELNEGNPAFTAKLRNYAGYGKLNYQVTPEVSIDAGVRYEKANQLVAPVQVFKVPGASLASTQLNRDYWLPAATVTWQFQPDMQLRINASKTIARPQFRELIYQPYFDPENNRQYIGNPSLVDSQLTNAEARIEWYFAPEQRLSVSGFYKNIKNPIEAFISGGDLTTSFANAPKATLWGASRSGEILRCRPRCEGRQLHGQPPRRRGRQLHVLEVQAAGRRERRGGGFRLVVDQGHRLFPQWRATDRPVRPHRQPADRLENTERLSQQTLMVSYASKRVVSRGLGGSSPQPDIVETPGLRVDIVVREEFKPVRQDDRRQVRSAQSHWARKYPVPGIGQEPDSDEQLRPGPQLLAVSHSQVLRNKGRGGNRDVPAPAIFASNSGA